jgi:hypothetical protein
VTTRGPLEGAHVHIGRAFRVLWRRLHGMEPDDLRDVHIYAGLAVLSVAVGLFDARAGAGVAGAGLFYLGVR